MQKLMSHQTDAVSKIMASFKLNKAFLLGDDVGLGKTRVACTIAGLAQKGQVLIVAPLSTFGGWLKEAEVIGLDLHVANEHWPAGKPAVLINYEKLDKFREVGSWTGKGTKDEPKTFEANPFSLVVWDEAHKLKSYKSKRHKIYEAIREKCNRTLFMTATPGQSPLDLKYLSEVIGFQPKSFWPWVRSFKGIWQPKWGGFQFRTGHLEDNRKLEAVIKGNERSLRRIPQEIAGWPELQRVIFPVKLNPSEGAEYERAFEDYMEALARAQRSINPAAEALVAVGQFRKCLSGLKVPYVVELTKDLLEQGKMVTISTEYLIPTADLSTELSECRVATISGETPSDRRQAILNASGMDQLDVVIFTVQEGINLQQPDTGRERVQIDMDIRWSALAQHQIDGRTHRAGKFALVYWVTVGQTVDDRVAKRLKERMETLSYINGEDFKFDPKTIAEI